MKINEMETTTNIVEKMAEIIKKNDGNFLEQRKVLRFDYLSQEELITLHEIVTQKIYKAMRK